MLSSELDDILRFLVKKKSIILSNGLYSLQNNLLRRLTEFSKEIASLRNWVGLPADDGTVRTSKFCSLFTLQSIGQLDVVLPKLHEVCLHLVRPGRTIHWHLEHSWWPLLRPTYSEESARNEPNFRRISFSTPSSAPVDIWDANFYKRLGMKVRLGSPIRAQTDLWAIDDIIVVQSFEKEIRREVDRFLVLARDPSDFEATKFRETFFGVSSPVNVHVWMSPANSLRLSARLLESESDAVISRFVV